MRYNVYVPGMVERIGKTVMEQIPYAGLESLFVGAPGKRRACGCLMSQRISMSAARVQLSGLVLDLQRDDGLVGSRI